MPKREPESIVAGSLWMVVVTLLLFWAPLVNGLVGGLIGGFKVGSVRRALLAAVLPALVVAGGLWILLTTFQLPVLGFVAGVAGLFIVLLADVGLFLGAALGALLARANAEKRLPA